MNIIKQFIAGFIATIVFHQGAVLIGYTIGVLPHAPYNTTPTEPFGIPSILSISFFGGLWGIVIWQIVKRFTNAKLWAASFLFGGVLLTAVAVAVVFPLKGIDVSVAGFLIGVVLNGLWGVGNTLFIKLFKAQ